jgi:hypothetical protein
MPNVNSPSDNYPKMLSPKCGEYSLLGLIVKESTYRLHDYKADYPEAVFLVMCEPSVNEL